MIGKIIIIIGIIVFASNASAQNPKKLINEGFALQEKFLHDSALLYYFPAAELFQNNRDWKNYFITLCRISRCLTITQKLDSSETYLQKAKELLSTKLAMQDSLQATLSYELAFLLRHKGEFYAAIDQLQKALAGYKDVLGDTHSLISDVYNNMALNYGELGDRAKEISFLEKSLQLQLVIKDQYDADFATAYSNLGTAYQNQGDCAKALSFYYKTLSIDRKVLGEEHPFIAQDYNLISSALGCLGRYDDAIINQEISQKMYIKILGENHYKVAYGYNNMGLAYAGKKAYDLAIRSMQKSVGLFQDLYPAGNYRTADVLYNLGTTLIKAGRFAEARQVLEESRQIMIPVDPDNFRIYKAYDMIGWSYFMENNYDKALTQIQRALEGFSGQSTNDIYNNPSSESIGSIYLFLQALNHKSIVLSGRAHSDDLINALKTSEYAIEILEDLLTEFKQEISKVELNQQSIGIYEQAIASAFQLYRITNDEVFFDKAFMFIEKSKAFVLRQSFREKEAQQMAGIPDSLKRKESYLRMTISRYQNEINQQGAIETNKSIDLKEKLFEKIFSYENLIRYYEDHFPAYYQVKYDLRTATKSEIQSQLKPGEVFLQIFDGDKQIYVLSVSKNAFEVNKVDRDSLMINAIRNYKKATTQYSFIMQQPRTADSVYISTAFFLYRSLLSPFEDLPLNPKIIISPDGDLSQVNFESFLSQNVPLTDHINYKSLPYLILDHTITYTNSGTLLIRGTNLRPEKKFAAFAPQYRSNSMVMIDTLNKSLVRLMNSDSWTLSAAQNEVKTIASELGGDLYLAEEASESGFKKAASQYEILHLAMHGIVNENIGETELIMLEETSGTEDGILRLAEIYNLELNAKLVVLGSCDSGSGQLKRGEGVLSVSRAFQYANCPSVIMSLWKIPDEASSHIMIGFYRSIQKGNTTDEGLRSSKINYINSQTDPLYGHPMYWAGFVLLGQPQTIKFGEKTYFFAFVLVGMLIITLVYFNRKLIYSPQ